MKRTLGLLLAAFLLVSAGTAFAKSHGGGHSGRGGYSRSGTHRHGRK